MKKILFFLFIILCIDINAQNYYTATVNGIEPREIIKEFDGKTKHEIYNSIKIWAANTYNNPEFVTKSDIEDEKLRFDGLWNIKSKGYFGTSYLLLSYTLNIDIKDGKIRYTLDNFRGLDNFTYENCFKSDGTRRKTKEVLNYLNDIELHAESFMKSIFLQIDNKNNW